MSVVSRRLDPLSKIPGSALENSVFFFEISSFVKEILPFFYYANEKKDEVINCSTQTVKNRIKNIFRNVRAVFFKLGTRIVHHKRKKNGAYCLGATTTLLAPVSFSQNLSDIMQRVR